MTHNPDSYEIKRMKYGALCESFRRDHISEDVFRASLYALGYRGRQIDDECAYQCTLKGPQLIGKAAERVISGLRYEFP
jgi:hypothetical protein